MALQPKGKGHEWETFVILTPVQCFVHFDSNYYVVLKTNQSNTHTHTHEKEEKKKVTLQKLQTVSHRTPESPGCLFCIRPSHSSQPFPGLDPLHKTSLYQKSFQQMLNGASESEVKAQVL